MAQLVISLNNQITQRIKLTKPTYTLGRNPQCDIVLPDRTVSSFHAKLVNSGKDCFLEDNDSTNGTFINGTVIQKYLLSDQDIIRMGNYLLHFHNKVDSNSLMPHSHQEMMA